MSSICPSSLIEDSDLTSEYCMMTICTVLKQTLKFETSGKQLYSHAHYSKLTWANEVPIPLGVINPKTLAGTKIDYRLLNLSVNLPESHCRTCTLTSSALLAIFTNIL